MVSDYCDRAGQARDGSRCKRLGETWTAFEVARDCRLLLVSKLNRCLALDARGGVAVLMRLGWIIPFVLLVACTGSGESVLTASQNNASSLSIGSPRRDTNLGDLSAQKTPPPVILHPDQVFIGQRSIAVACPSRVVNDPYHCFSAEIQMIELS